jgi:hypothetical protein
VISTRSPSLTFLSSDPLALASQGLNAEDELNCLESQEDSLPLTPLTSPQKKGEVLGCSYRTPSPKQFIRHFTTPKTSLKNSEGKEISVARSAISTSILSFREHLCSETQVKICQLGEYGSDIFSQMVVNYKRKHHISSSRNVALLVYKNGSNNQINYAFGTSGDLGPETFSKIPCGAHAELVVYDYIPEAVRKEREGNKIIALYTERQPCTHGKNCNLRLKNLLKKPVVLYSFPYSSNKAERKKSENHLKSVESSFGIPSNLSTLSQEPYFSIETSALARTCRKIEELIEKNGTFDKSIFLSPKGRRSLDNLLSFESNIHPDLSPYALDKRKSDQEVSPLFSLKKRRN